MSADGARVVQLQANVRLRCRGQGSLGFCLLTIRCDGVVRGSAVSLEQRTAKGTRGARAIDRAVRGSPTHSVWFKSRSECSLNLRIKGKLARCPPGFIVKSRGWFVIYSEVNATCQ